ncbi:MAG: exopolyphosphatase [Candidatus Binatia bacterium]
MRLVTRPDFDGVVCGSLITAMEPIDSYLFVEPKFMQDGSVDIRPGDIIANLPYHRNCALWFDHHYTNAPAWEAYAGVSSSEFLVSSSQPETGNQKAETRNPTIVPGKGGFRLAPSAARVVYEYYTATEVKEQKANGKRVQEDLERITSERFQYLLHETDRVDSGNLTPEDALNPAGYVLISMTIDGKKENDEPYWRHLIALLRDLPLQDVLADSIVHERCQEILAAQERLKQILLKRTTLKGNVIYVDLRGVEEVPDGNRFLLYTLFPSGNISMKIADDPQRPYTVAISVGYNIFNATSKVNVGALLEKHGGGGHRVVGSCRVPAHEAEKAIQQIFAAIRE